MSYRYENYEAADILRNIESQLIKPTAYMDDKIRNTILKLYIDMQNFNRKNNIQSTMRHNVTVCLYGESIVGMQYFYWDKYSKEATLFSIYVDKDHRGHKISKKLIDMALDKIKSCNIKVIKVPLSTCSEDGTPKYYLKKHINALKNQYLGELRFDISLND